MPAAVGEVWRQLQMPIAGHGEVHRQQEEDRQAAGQSHRGLHQRMGARTGCLLAEEGRIGRTAYVQHREGDQPTNRSVGILKERFAAQKVRVRSGSVAVLQPAGHCKESRSAAAGGSCRELGRCQRREAEVRTHWRRRTGAAEEH